MNKKRLSKLLAAALALIFVSWSSIASAKDKMRKKWIALKNAATVLKEILDVPDNISAGSNRQSALRNCVPVGG